MALDHLVLLVLKVHLVHLVREALLVNLVILGLRVRLDQKAHLEIQGSQGQLGLQVYLALLVPVDLVVPLVRLDSLDQEVI